MPAAAPPVELLPPRRQALWGWPAVLNFFLGGLGAGFYAVAALLAGLGRSPALGLAAWTGPVLVLAGFAAVAAEAGRPLRGARVLWRVQSSWMSRELWIGGAFALLALADLAAPLGALRLAATAAALALAAAQGFVLQQARGVTAWNVPIMPAVFLLSALVSGAGLHVAAEAAAGRGPGGVALAAALAVLAAGLAVWARYLTGSRDAHFAAAVRALAAGAGGRAIAGGGYAAPFALLVLGIAVPAAAGPAALAAGVVMIGGQLIAKALLILSAGHLRPVTLAGIRLERRIT
jgi:DMSO reductase anchor subunit